MEHLRIMTETLKYADVTDKLIGWAGKVPHNNKRIYLKIFFEALLQLNANFNTKILQFKLFGNNLL